MRSALISLRARTVAVRGRPAKAATSPISAGARTTPNRHAPVRAAGADLGLAFEQKIGEIACVVLRHQDFAGREQAWLGARDQRVEMRFGQVGETADGAHDGAQV